MVQKNSISKKILIICGPTASSKTALSIECAKLLDSEIISADSMNIYKGLDIGTAKPTISEREGIPHHLIDVITPKEEFTVSDYKDLASPIVERLLNEGKTPIICGGTGFYINSLLYDMSYGNGTGNLEVREKYKKIAENEGVDTVYNVLKSVDPESAKKLHPNDLKRVIRALEIYENGTKKSDIKDDLTPKYSYLAVANDYPRAELYSRIDSRVDLMIESGLIEEVKGLIDSGITIKNQCMQGIGYKEVYSYLQGEISREKMVELIKINTRHYAKRQITFFKRLDGLVYLTPNDTKNTAKRIVEKLL